MATLQTIPSPLEIDLQHGIARLEWCYEPMRDRFHFGCIYRGQSIVNTFQWRLELDKNIAEKYHEMIVTMPREIDYYLDAIWC